MRGASSSTRRCRERKADSGPQRGLVEHQVPAVCRRGGALEPQIRGQIEGIHTAPHFIARSAQARCSARRPGATALRSDTRARSTHLAEFLRATRQGCELEAVGHRVVHGGPEYAPPVRVDRDVLAALEKLVPLAPLHQPHNLAPIRTVARRAARTAAGRVLRYGVPFAPTPTSRSGSRCRPSCTMPACAATDSTGCRTSTSRRCCPSTTRARRPAGRSSATSATARACARCRRGEASRARWASPRSTACRWAHAAARSIPACCSI